MHPSRQIGFRSRIWSQFSDSGNRLIKSSDFLRSWFLRRTLKIHILRKVYAKSSLRLGAAFILCTLINLPIALVRPDLLLIFGPLIYGYFHLIATYYFIQPTNQCAENTKVSKKKFKYFWYVSLIAILVNLYIASFKEATELPHGSWEMITAIGMFCIYSLWTKQIKKKTILLVLALNILIFKVAWNEPLNFVSATLFLHNWIAFFYWIIIAKDKANRLTALLATFSFGIVHYLIAFGYFDHLIFIRSEESILAANVEGTSWALAPWSSDPIVGLRALVLYTYGLSTHYFVWLKAIPENRQEKESPNSFKVGFELLKNNIGKPTTRVVVIITIVGTILWLYSFSLGATIYFTIASIHIWLEVDFLVPRAISFMRRFAE